MQKFERDYNIWLQYKVPVSSTAYIRPGLALINPLRSNINMHILNIVFYTILMVLLEKICLNIEAFHLD